MELIYLDKYFILWNFYKCDRKEKRGRGTVPAGPEQPQGSGPASEAAQHAGARMRARFKPDGRGPGVRERERGAMEGRG